MMRWLAIIFFGVLATQMIAATPRFVRSADGNNANDGTADDAAHAWKTFAYAESQATPGMDIQFTGVFNEEVVVNCDGVATNWITFRSKDRNNKAIIRKLDMQNADYVRIQDLEFTHTNTTYAGAITLTSCTHIDILHNYIHNVRGRASGEGAVVSDTHGNPSSYVTIRGNHFYYVGYQSGVFSYANIACIFSDFPSSHHWLIEHNKLERSADFVYNYGQDHTVRNNQMWDAGDYWPGGGPLPHTDFDQSGSDGVTGNTMRKVYEANFDGDNNLSDGHWFLQQNNPGSGTDADMLLRGNVVYHLGSGPLAAMNTPRLKAYNNSFYDILGLVSGKIFRWWGVNNPTGGMFANNIVAVANSHIDVPGISIETGSATVVTNLGYQAGSDSSYVSTSDPQFTDPTDPARNFHLGSSSPAKGTGAKLVTITSSSSSGTTFNVNDGGLLSDGKGVTRGDYVKIGSVVTYITAISGNSVTVNDSVTWTPGDPVYWNAQTTPDIGGLPFNATNLTAASITTVSGTNYVVTMTGHTRFVVYYQDGLPVTNVYCAPFQQSVTNSFTSGTITAVAYALYAQQDPWVSASSGGGGGDTTPPTLTSATIGSDGMTWTLTFNENAQVGAGGSGGFAAAMAFGTFNLTYSSGSGSSTLVFTGGRTVSFRDTGTLAYTQPGNGIEDTSGNDLVTFSGATVVNGSTKGIFYVSTTGSAGAAGTNWTTAVTLTSLTTNALFNYGALTYLANGNYTNAPYVFANISNVVFASTNKFGPNITGSATLGIGGSSSASFFTAGLTFIGIQCSSNATDGMFGRRDTLFQDCWVHHNGRQGINTSASTAASNIVDRCLVEENGSDPSNPGHFHGWYLSGPGNVGRNSVFRRNGSGAGVHCYTEAAGVLNWDNEFYNVKTYGHTNLYGLLCWNGNEDATHLPGTNRVYGCTILDGLGTAYGTIYVSNNIILPNVIAPTLPIAASGGARAPTVVANYNGSSVALTPSGANDVITNDFKFVNSANGLFWLRSISAARNAAKTTVFGPVDFFDNTQTSVTDIGAVQYSTAYEADMRTLDPSPVTGADYWAAPGVGTHFMHTSTSRRR